MSDDWGWDEPDGGSGGATATGNDPFGVCPNCGESSDWCQCSKDGTGSGDGGQQVFAQPKPPVTWLWGAIGIAVVGLVLGAVFRSSLILPLIGWLLAGPAAVLVYGHFVGATTKVSAMSGYGRPSWLPMVMKVVPVLILVAVAVCAYSIADYIARHW